MQATARRLSVVSATSCARRRLIRNVRLTTAFPDEVRQCFTEHSGDLLSLCIASGYVAALTPFLRDSPPCPHDFPELRRLVDFVAGPALGYRVCRCSICDEFISIRQTDTPSSEPGFRFRGYRSWAPEMGGLRAFTQHEEDDAANYNYHRHGNDWSRYQ